MTARPERPHVGDKPVIFVDCTDTFGVATTPTAGRLLYLKPGAAASVEVAFSALTKAPDFGEGPVVGRVEWIVDPALDTPGKWKFWWEFTAGIEGAEPYELDVLPQTVPDPP